MSDGATVYDVVTWATSSGDIVRTIADDYWQEPGGVLSYRCPDGRFGMFAPGVWKQVFEACPSSIEAMYSAGTLDHQSEVWWNAQEVDE